MSDDPKYSLHVHPGTLSKECAVQTIPATKRTTALEVISQVVSRLALDDDQSYVLVELHNHKGEEMVLAEHDHPVQRMLLWPRQYQHTYKFILRQTNKDGTVLYHGATTWQAKADKDSSQRHMAQKGFLPPTEPSAEDYPDLCCLTNLTQDKILEVLKMRFLKDKIYTYTANMLISINPYKFLPIYNPKFMTIYQNRKKEELAPHIYAIADAAFTKMVESKQNQCVVITGKSGSGKTQATHFLVHHTLALCQKSYMTGVEHMLIGCGPVLEALGNAQTEHNHNSSRFGKFLRIYFYESGLLSGADIQTYLLEKSRLVHQEAHERNFHIFYYLLCGASDEELKELYLDQDTVYGYVNKGNLMSRHEASSELDRLRQAMEVIGFFNGAQRNIFKLISAILLLGNITFRVKKGRDEALEIEDESYLYSVSKLLSLDPNIVKKCLLTRKARAGAGERFVLDLKLNEAIATRDAMAKGLYQMLFEWTVNSVNMALAQRTRDSKLRSQSRWIGLLDIFGFEDFVKNSFEQFCINYASEHLQHYCIKHTFQIEQEVYRLEGLTWKEVDYADNSGCLELYEKKPMGLFYLIDENFPGANNQTLLSQFNRVHNSNPYFESPVVKEDAFIIKHYAGKVKYQIKDFREKNHDQVREDIITLLRATKSSFIQEVISRSPAALFRWSILRAVVRATFAFKNGPTEKSKERSRLHATWRYDDLDGKHVQASYVHKKMMARLSHHRNSVPTVVYSPRDGANLYGKRKVTPSRSKKKTNSISQQYQASLSALLNALKKADPYFVRCIQPNNKKTPLKLDPKLVLHQLRCSGTLQTIQLLQSRYNERFTTDQFLEQYKLLFPKTTHSLTLRQIEEHLLSLKLSLQTHFQVGRRQIFLRDSACHVLQDELHKAVLQRVVCLQKHVRGSNARKNFIRQREAAIKIQSFWRMVETQREIEEWHLAASIIQDAWHVYQNRKFKTVLIQIQAHCRGFITRQRINERTKSRTFQSEDLSARIIQRSWLKYKNERDSAAAVIIQKSFRGFLARTIYHKMQEESRMALKCKQEEMKKKRQSDTLSLPYIDETNDSPSSHDGSKTPERMVDEIEPGDGEENNNHLKPLREPESKMDHKTPDEPASLKAKVSKTSDKSGVMENKPNYAKPDQSLVADEILNHSEELTKKAPYSARENTTKHNHIKPVKQPSAFREVPLQPTHKSAMVLKEKIQKSDLPVTNHRNIPETQLRKPSPNGSMQRMIETPSSQEKSSVQNGSTHASKQMPTSKVGDIFLKAAFPNKDVVKPVVYKPSPRKNRYNDEDVADIGRVTGSYDLLKRKDETPKESFTYVSSQSKADEILDSAPEKPNSTQGKPNSTQGKPNSTQGKPNSTQDKPNSTPDDPSKDEHTMVEKLTNETTENENMKSASEETLTKYKIPKPTGKYTETTFPADNMNVTEAQSSKDNDIARLQKEWLAFQRVEHERQLRELDRRVQDGPKRENKQQRKIREEITSLRLEQMSLLKEKMESFGVGIESMPDLPSLSRKSSEKNEPETSSPPISPISSKLKPPSPSKLTPTSPSKLSSTSPSKLSSTSQKPNIEPLSAQHEVKEPVKIHTFARSSSMESITPRDVRPRRQRSNSAIEMYIDMRTPATDPISRKACSLNAEAFAKKCMEEAKLEVLESEDEIEKAETTPQSEGKRGSAFIEAMRKTFWGSSRGQTRQHQLVSEKKSTDSLTSLATANEKPASDENEVIEVKVRSLEAEQFSPKLLVSKAEELIFLEKFIKNKTSSFDGTHLVDQVFKTSLNEFCANLTAFYSLAQLSGSTNGLRYKDIVSNFRLVLEKTANHYSLDQYAAMMAVNGFRGYMNEFMNDVLPKHIVKEARAKKKKLKDDSVERMGHHFAPVQWGITQICEFCGGTMWLMESGLVCKVCKFACHKKCFKQLTTRCSGSPLSGRPKTKPKKLFGETLVSLEGNDSLVPTFIDKCISYMEANGIYQEGIYRRSAAATQNKQLEDALNKDTECQKVNFDDYNIHCVASCFKKFLRSLPQPLVPQDKYFEFLQASKLTNDREKITSLFSVLEGIPEHNHATLERIVFHLARVALQEPTNLMSPSNLAIVFTPCFFSPPAHVSPVTAAEHVGSMTKGVELVINEQVKKIRRTLESISEIQHVESSTNERLKQIRQSLGKGNRKRIRPSFRDGPRSPTHRRPLVERRASLDAVEEDNDLAKEEQKYEMNLATLKSRKESLTTRLPALTPQLTSDVQPHVHNEQFNQPYCMSNEHLRHLNKHRVSALPRRRRPARFASSLYSPNLPDPPKEEVKPLRKVSTAKGRFKRLTSIGQFGEGDSFRRTSLMRNPIHRPHRKRAVNITSSLLADTDLKVGKITSV